MSEKRVIGIRGLDESIYDEIQKIAKEKNQNIADIFNDALRQYLISLDNDYIPPNIISGHMKFIVNSEALIQLNPLRIENVDKVIIENDEKLTLDLIETNLEGIKSANYVYVPQQFYYIIIKKSKHCQNIEPYEGKYRAEENLEFNSSVKITSSMLERFKNQNKRVRIKAYGDIYFDYKIDTDLFDEVVSSLKINGGLYCSEELQPIVLTKGSVTGNLGIIDENNNPIEVTQVNSKINGKQRRRENVPAPFIDLSGISEAIKEVKRALSDLGPEFQDNIKKAFTNSDLDGEYSFKKKRKKYHPSKGVKIDINTDFDDESNTDEDSLDSSE
ncbi:MAG: hypothetical protein ACFFD1_02260 [Candidatus Thorarchaeota archaeon]